MYEHLVYHLIKKGLLGIDEHGIVFAIKNGKVDDCSCGEPIVVKWLKSNKSNKSNNDGDPEYNDPEYRSPKYNRAKDAIYNMVAYWPLIYTIW
jgi:hypothetical protein